MLLLGDSIALGLAQFLHPRHVDAAVGRGSAVGAVVAQHHGDRTLVVSLGVNDDPRQVAQFRRRVVVVLRGRRRVVWLTMRRHPGFNRVLRRVARARSRLRVVDGLVPTVDGTHPTVGGYRTLAHRITRALDAGSSTGEGG